MKAYYYDDAPGDPRLPHHPPSAPAIPPSHLTTLGLLHTHIPVPPRSGPSSPALDALARARGYLHRDVVTVSRAAMGAAYEAKIAAFFAEHMHEDEEIRYVVGGAGYFDVREVGDARWVRVRLEEGDLLVLPAGIYHRFTTDEGDYVQALRLFREAPRWTPLGRGEETEGNAVRRGYVEGRERAVRGEGKSDELVGGEGVVV
ncbi:1,2-dihydroxy-3-keto-5-methylthiopentene dioxygenase [Xylographa trunciseda]|nr:1,2-dihydroxy-3-keto-5-methylthiopentene dioxygenase [Xylographa trunciseda]